MLLLGVKVGTPICVTNQAYNPNAHLLYIYPMQLEYQFASLQC